MAAPSLFGTPRRVRSPTGGTPGSVAAQPDFAPAGGGMPTLGVAPSTPSFSGLPTPRAAASTPTPPTPFPGGSNPYTGLVYNKGYSDIAHQSYNQLGTRLGRSNQLYGDYTSALEDPAGTAGKFTDFFKTAAEGISAPAMRDFNKEVSGVQANTAARFGGNASSEEARNTYNTSDLFSRNLTEALARLAPQAAGLGLEYTGELGQAARGATNEQDQLTQIILQALNKPKKPNTLGQIAGTALGAGIGLLGGPAGAKAGAGAGAMVGESL